MLGVRACRERSVGAHPATVMSDSVMGQDDRQVGQLAHRALCAHLDAQMLSIAIAGNSLVPTLECVPDCECKRTWRVHKELTLQECTSRLCMWCVVLCVVVPLVRDPPWVGVPPLRSACSVYKFGDPARECCEVLE